MRGNAEQNNSEYEHFLCSEYHSNNVLHTAWKNYKNLQDGYEHQDMYEFYYNIIDTLLDEDMIAMSIKSLFKTPETGINRCLQCNDMQVKKHMGSYIHKSFLCLVSSLNRSSVTNNNSILWYHFTFDINEKTWFLSNVKTKMVFIKQILNKIYWQLSRPFLLTF